MWICKQCSSEVEDSFQLCWSCGTAADGTPDPTFERSKGEPSGTPVSLPEPGAAVEPPAWSQLPLDELLASRFRCPKCLGRGARTKGFAATGTGLSKVFDIHHNRFLAVSCTRCAFTEIYDPEILADPAVRLAVLSLLLD